MPRAVALSPETHFFCCRCAFHLLGVLMIVGFVCGDSSAAFALEKSPIAKLNPLATGTYSWLKGIAYGIAGLSAVGAGAVAFMGRFPWGWLFSLIGSIVVASASDEIISFISG